MTACRHGQLGLLVLCGLAGASPLGCGGRIETGPETDDLGFEVSTGGSPVSNDGTSTGGAGGTGGQTLQPGAGGALHSGGGLQVEDEPNMPGPTGIADPEAFCARVCKPERLNNPCAEDQACSPGWCLAEAEHWDPSAADAFEKCVSEEPLCFRSIDGCMLDVLYPATAPRTHILVIENLEPDVLTYVYAGAVSPDDLAPLLGDTFTTEGAAWMSWFSPWEGDLGPSFYVWIDVDQDGLCESGQDSFGVAVAQWNGSLDSPTYEAHVTEYFEDGAAACPISGFTDVGENP